MVIKKIKKKIYAFLVQEKGNISRQKALTLGAFLSAASILSLLPTVAATHTNSFNVSWDSGVITAEHGHHASHASHSSHASHYSCEDEWGFCEHYHSCIVDIGVKD